MTHKLTRRASIGAISALTGSPSIARLNATTQVSSGAVVFASKLEEIALAAPGPNPIVYVDGAKSGLFVWEAGDCGSSVAIDPKQAVSVPPHSDPTGASGVWRRVVEDDLHIYWFGALFDVGRVQRIEDATDDGEAWQAALDYLAAVGGGTLRLPMGASKVGRQLSVRGDSIRLVGAGSPKVYPGKFVPGVPCLSTLVPVHSDRCAMRFVPASGSSGGFQAESFNLATLERGTVPEAAFGWEVGHAFGYGFNFRNIGVFGFKSAFDVYKAEGAEMAVGAVLIDDCAINRNRWIVRNLDNTHFNGFTFSNNKAGQNGYQIGEGGLSLSGCNINITQNILEATRDPISISGGFRSLIIEGNYFEANVGTACIALTDIAGPYQVGPNNFDLLDAAKVDHKVLLKFCGLGLCIDPYWPAGTHKPTRHTIGGVAASSLNNRLDRANNGYFRTDAPSVDWLSAPPFVTISVSLVGGRYERATNPLTGGPMPSWRFTTSSNTYIARNLRLSGKVNNWAVLCWLFRRLSDGNPSGDPYLSLKVNDGAAGGGRDFVYYNFSQAWRDDNWCLLTAAIRLTAPMSSLAAVLYPFGIKASAGRSAHFLPPAAYTVDDINDAAPYLAGSALCTVASPPVSGEWFTGDMLDNSHPAPAASRFVCVTGGSPGTWIAV